MKRRFFTLFLFGMSLLGISAQHIEFEEYTLDNGLHVVLYQDKSAPLVTTSVMYHVGSKDEASDRTGFAHFFEHLLFEGTQNIARGEWDKLVGANGGVNNANTSTDRTYYYTIFPSNNLELALWMESERMLHPVINKVGVDTQRGVIKEEKRQRVDNAPYGKVWEALNSNLYKNHPYRWETIGSMDDLDAATLDEFQQFFKKYYAPGNAVLVVAGDINISQAKKWINEYFSSIPKGNEVVKAKFVEEPIARQIDVTFEDPNIQMPMIIEAYRMPSMKERDAYVLDMISTVLSEGKSSRLYKRLVDKEKLALEAASFLRAQEDYSTYLIFALPMTGKTKDDLLDCVQDEINKMRTELISEREYQKLQNKIENNFISKNSTTDGIAHTLAESYLLYGDTNLINTELDIYKSVTREEIRDVAAKYLQPNQRVVLDYIPKK